MERKEVREIINEIINCYERHSQSDQVGGLYPEDILIKHFIRIVKKRDEQWQLMIKEKVPEIEFE